MNNMNNKNIKDDLKKLEERTENHKWKITDDTLDKEFLEEISNFYLYYNNGPNLTEAELLVFVDIFSLFFDNVLIDYLANKRTRYMNFLNIIIKIKI
jgi:hypothetical protein